MTTDVQRWCAFRRPDRPPKGYLEGSPLDQLTPQERQMRAVLRGLQEYRWQLRKAEPNSPEALRYARCLARTYQRWKALYDNWVPGPSGYRPQKISLLGRKPEAPPYEIPPITGEFSDPLPPGRQGQPLPTGGGCSRTGV